MSARRATLCPHLTDRYAGQVYALGHMPERLWCESCFRSRALLEDTNPSSTCDTCGGETGPSEGKTLIHNVGAVRVAIGICNACAGRLEKGEALRLVNV